jgi:hypothetical protein
MLANEEALRLGGEPECPCADRRGRGSNAPAVREDDGGAFGATIGRRICSGKMGGLMQISPTPSVPRL